MGTGSTNECIICYVIIEFEEIQMDLDFGSYLLKLILSKVSRILKVCYTKPSQVKNPNILLDTNQYDYIFLLKN